MTFKGCRKPRGSFHGMMFRAVNNVRLSEDSGVGEDAAIIAGDRVPEEEPVDTLKRFRCVGITERNQGAEVVAVEGRAVDEIRKHAVQGWLYGYDVGNDHAVLSSRRVPEEDVVQTILVEVAAGKFAEIVAIDGGILDEIRLHGS